MVPTQKTRELARSLVADATNPNIHSLHAEPATVRVYEGLRRRLGTAMGVDGFQALASRALALAKAESPQLRGVRVTANGGLYGLDDVESQTAPDNDGEAGILLIAQLLGLFLTFLGDATTLRLLEDLRLQIDVRTKPATLHGSEDSSAEEIATIGVFEDLLLEINRLRSVSEHIEVLSANHLGMEEGFLRIAGNIRSLATVLDIFTLIRSKAGGPRDEVPDLRTNRYMN
jgi:hypothetical protein